MSKILIVDDDPILLSSVARLVESAGLLVDRAESLAEAEHYRKSIEYDVIVIDWKLPDGQGPDFVAAARRDGFVNGIVLLTAQNSVASKEVGFEHGADDYVCKPFEPRELLARIRALLRRAEKAYNNSLDMGNLHLDLDSRVLKVRDEEITLQHQEFILLQFLLKHPDEFFSAEQLLTRLWSTDSDSGVETVRTTVYKLRRKLEAREPTHNITTQYKLGYKLGPVLESGKRELIASE